MAEMTILVSSFWKDDESMKKDPDGQPLTGQEKKTPERPGRNAASKYFLRRQHMETLRHILVVSWLTEHCGQTIQVGISLAGKFEAELSVVHVTDTTWLKGWSIPMVSMEEERKREIEKNKEALHKILRVPSSRLI